MTIPGEEFKGNNENCIVVYVRGVAVFCCKVYKGKCHNASLYQRLVPFVIASTAHTSDPIVGPEI